MIEKMRHTITALKVYDHYFGTKPSVGEVAKCAGLSKSTVKRYLQKAEKLGMCVSETVEYKKTGKTIFEITQSGLDFLSGFRELGL